MIANPGLLWFPSIYLALIPWTHEISQICFLPCTKVEAKNAAHATIQRNYVGDIQPTPSSYLERFTQQRWRVCVSHPTSNGAHLVAPATKEKLDVVLFMKDASHPRNTEEPCYFLHRFWLVADVKACQNAFEIPKFIDYLWLSIFSNLKWVLVRTSCPTIPRVQISTSVTTEKEVNSWKSDAALSRGFALSTSKPGCQEATKQQSHSEVQSLYLNSGSISHHFLIYPIYPNTCLEKLMHSAGDEAIFPTLGSGAFHWPVL